MVCKLQKSLALGCSALPRLGENQVFRKLTEENSEKMVGSLASLMQNEEFASNQQLLGKFIGAGTGKWDNNFYYFFVQFLFDTVESCWVLTLV